MRLYFINFHEVALLPASPRFQWNWRRIYEWLKSHIKWILIYSYEWNGSNYITYEISEWFQETYWPKRQDPLDDYQRSGQGWLTALHGASGENISKRLQCPFVGRRKSHCQINSDNGRRALLLVKYIFKKYILKYFLNNNPAFRVLVLWRWGYSKGKTLTEIQPEWPTGFSLLLPLIRKQVVGTADAQGLGRHTEAEVMEMGANDLKVLSVTLSRKPYFMGDKATELDCAVFGSLAQVLWCTPGCPLGKLLHGNNLLLKSVIFLEYVK